MTRVTLYKALRLKARGGAYSLFLGVSAADRTRDRLWNALFLRSLSRSFERPGAAEASEKKCRTVDEAVPGDVVQ